MAYGEYLIRSNSMGKVSHRLAVCRPSYRFCSLASPPPGSAGNNARDTDIPRPGCESEHGSAGIRPSPMSS
jgi:hypothetical protein